MITRHPGPPGVVRRRARYGRAASLLLLVGAACSQSADEAPVAPPGPAVATRPAALESVAVSPTQHLRQLSLDLRGRPPSDEEYDAVDAAGEVPAAMIEAMLRSPEFLGQVRDWHAQALWPNIERYRLQAITIVAPSPEPSPDNQDVSQAKLNAGESISP